MKNTKNKKGYKIKVGNKRYRKKLSKKLKGGSNNLNFYTSNQGYLDFTPGPILDSNSMSEGDYYIKKAKKEVVRGTTIFFYVMVVNIGGGEYVSYPINITHYKRNKNYTIEFLTTTDPTDTGEKTSVPSDKIITINPNDGIENGIEKGLEGIKLKKYIKGPASKQDFTYLGDTTRKNYKLNEDLTIRIELNNCFNSKNNLIEPYPEKEVSEPENNNHWSATTNFGDLKSRNNTGPINYTGSRNITYSLAKAQEQAQEQAQTPEKRGGISRSNKRRKGVRKMKSIGINPTQDPIYGTSENPQGLKENTSTYGGIEARLNNNGKIKHMFTKNTRTPQQIEDEQKMARQAMRIVSR
jgi:hypothetical protein